MTLDSATHDTVLTVLRYDGVWYPGKKAYDVSQHRGNLLMTAGITALWNLVAGLGGTAFSNAAAYVGVGDSATAASAGQTDLQAATNKLRGAVSIGSPGVSGAAISYQAIFGTASANFAWNEMAVFNASSGGTMLNRVVSSQGTKTSAQSWACVVTITLS